ncbi:MAG: ABC transporter permease [Treponema sp.]|jgi:peptide/nickel transport system permease protein|nr:ABC transporter permease [Treponema sp.]
MILTIFRRVGGSLLTLLLASLVLFIMIRLAPGDPIMLLMGQPGDLGISDTKLMRERIEAIRAEHGLDQGIMTQYGRWLKNLVTLNLGNSIQTRRPVITEIGERVPATLLLSFAALFLQILLGTAGGTYTAVKAGKPSDGAIRLVCVFFASVPGFVIALFLLSICAVKFHVYEISSSGGIHRLWLPALTLALAGAPQIIRMIRANILSELGQVYVSSAISRGLSKGLVVKNALQNALLPAVTAIGLSLTHLTGGAVVIESIFSWPGIGNYAMNSILMHDYPAIQGYAVLTVSAVIIINLMVDLTYILIDPRIRGNEG